MTYASGLTNWLKLIHVLAVALWVGGAMLVNFYGMAMQKADASRRLHFAEQNDRAGRLFSASAIIALITGVWIVLRVEGIEFSQAWISIGFLGIAVGAVLGMGFFGPQGRALIAEMKEGSPAAAVRAKRIALVSQIDLLVLLVVVWAMVFKPGL
jgi:uncharacterized membrane protein